jgi:hypothetical protein
MHILAGACGVLLAGWSLINPRIRVYVAQPFVIVPLLLAIWSATIGVFHPTPWLSFRGSPEVGEGVLWFSSIAMFIAATQTLSAYPIHRMFLLSSIMSSAATLGGMTWWYENVSKMIELPYFFPDYLAFLGGFIFAASFGLSNGLRFRNIFVGAGLLLSIGLIVTSSNRASQGLALVIPFLWFLSAKLPISNKVLKILGITAVLLIPIIVTILLFSPALPELAKPFTFLGMLANSMLSRAHLLSIVWNDLSANPGSLFTGWGWGSYSDLFAINLPIDWAFLRDDESARQVGVGTHWDAIHRVDFHSHNFIAEAMIGGGIIAIFLTLFLIAMLIIWSSRHHQRAAIATAIFTSGTAAFWFMLPICPPFMAIAWGSLAKRATLYPWRRLFRKWLAPALGGLGALTLLLGIENWRFISYAYTFTPSLTALPANQDWRKACPNLFNDNGRGGMHLAFRLRVLEQSVLADLSKTDVEPSEEKLSFLRGAICASEDYIDRGSIFRLRVSSLLARSDLAFGPSHPALLPITDIYLASWGQRLEEALRIAPKRTDLAAGYLLWLFKEGREDEFNRWSSKIYEMDRKSPVGLWFSGIALSANPTRGHEGIARMRQAIRAGIERIIPVEDELKQQLGH